MQKIKQRARRPKLVVWRTEVKKQLFGHSQVPQGKVGECLDIAIGAMQTGRRR